MRSKFWSSKKLSTETVRKLWKRWSDGVPIKDLARERGVTPEGIQYLFRSRGMSLVIQKECVLPECRKPFTTRKPRQRACCRKHVKLAHSREGRGVTTIQQPCALPECDVQVWMTHKAGRKPTFGSKGGSGKRYCTHAHSTLQTRRRQSGVYLNMLGRGARCAAPTCRETLILDEHHEEFDRKTHKSNKSSRTYWLCPTHHMKIHRGFATLRDGVYTDLVPKVLAGIRKKTKMFHRYNDILLAYSWAEAK